MALNYTLPSSGGQMTFNYGFNSGSSCIGEVKNITWTTTETPTTNWFKVTINTASTSIEVSAATTDGNDHTVTLTPSTNGKSCSSKTIAVSQANGVCNCDALTYPIVCDCTSISPITTSELDVDDTEHKITAFTLTEEECGSGVTVSCATPNILLSTEISGKNVICKIEENNDTNDRSFNLIPYFDGIPCTSSILKCIQEKTSCYITGAHPHVDSSGCYVHNESSLVTDLPCECKDYPEECGGSPLIDCDQYYNGKNRFPIADYCKAYGEKTIYLSDPDGEISVGDKKYTTNFSKYGFTIEQIERPYNYFVYITCPNPLTDSYFFCYEKNGFMNNWFAVWLKE